MPATTEAHNDVSGNVTFGDITFTMENVSVTQVFRKLRR